MLQVDPAELELRDKIGRVPSLSKFGKWHAQSIRVLHREPGFTTALLFISYVSFGKFCWLPHLGFLTGTMDIRI